MLELSDGEFFFSVCLLYLIGSDGLKNLLFHQMFDPSAKLWVFELEHGDLLYK